MKERPPASETELEVLKALWKHGPATVRDLDQVLREEGRRWAYSTILTLVQRLQAKRYVRSDRRALAHVFSASVSREDLLSERLRALADDVCEGTATPLVRALVEGGRFAPGEVEELRRLVQRLEPTAAERKGRKAKD